MSDSLVKWAVVESDGFHLGPFDDEPAAVAFRRTNAGRLDADARVVELLATPRDEFETPAVCVHCGAPICQGYDGRTDRSWSHLYDGIREGLRRCVFD